MKNQIKKDFFWNTLGSLVNSFTSLFFMMVIVRINGVEKSGIFTFAFSTACLFQIIGTYSGRPFQVTERNKKISDSDYIISRYITCSFVLFLSIMFMLIKDYSFYKNTIIIILVLYKIIEAFSEVIYGIIQKNDKLDKVGKSLFIKGLLGFLVLLIIDIITKNMVISCLSLIFINLVIFTIYDLRNLKECKYSKTKFNITVLKVGFYTFLFTFLTQYLINAPKFAIDSNLDSTSQAIYGVIAMPATFMVLCGQFLIHPFLNKLTNALNEEKYKIFNKLTLNLAFTLLGLGLIVILVAYFLGIPVLQIIYGIKLKNYLLPFVVIIIGSVLYAVSTIIQNSLVALRKTKIQALIFIIDSIVIFILSKVLVVKYGLLGASLSYSICMLLLLIMYIIIYFIEINKYLKGDVK